MSSTAILIGLAVAALVVCATGVVLTARRRPYSQALQNVHKYVALAATAVIVWMVWSAATVATFSQVGLFTAISAAVLTVVAFGSGGVTGTREDAPAWVLWAHRALSWVAVLAAAAMVGMVTGAF
jgi:hypothetical protein